MTVILRMTVIWFENWIFLIIPKSLTICLVFNGIGSTKTFNHLWKQVANNLENYKVPYIIILEYYKVVCNLGPKGCRPLFILLTQLYSTLLSSSSFPLFFLWIVLVLSTVVFPSFALLWYRHIHALLVRLVARIFISCMNPRMLRVLWTQLCVALLSIRFVVSPTFVSLRENVLDKTRRVILTVRRSSFQKQSFHFLSKIVFSSRVSE